MGGCFKLLASVSLHFFSLYRLTVLFEFRPSAMADHFSGSRRRFLLALGVLGGGGAGLGVLSSSPLFDSKSAPSELAPPESATDVTSFDHRVSTIDELRSVAPANGESAVVLGYHAPMDGGGGVFVFHSTAPREDVDGGLHIAPHTADDSSPGLWHRLTTSDAVNARWYGAEPDPSTNQAPAIRQAIRGAAATTGRLHIPKGTYGVEGRINLPSGLTMEGAGMGTTTLRVLPEASSIERTLQAVGATDAYVHDVTIRDLTVDGNRHRLTQIGDTEEEHSAIYLIYVENVLLERVEAVNAQGAGFRIGAIKQSDPARNVTLRDCRATGNFQNGVAPTLVDNFLMDGCYVAGTEFVVSVDFETHGPMDVKRNCTVRDCTFEGQGVHWLGPSPNDPEQYRNLTVENCTFLNAELPLDVRDVCGCRIVNNTILRTDDSLESKPAIYVLPNADVPAQSVLISGNEIRDTTGTQSDAIYVGKTEGAIITDNQIEGGRSGIRLVSGAQHTRVSGNVVRNVAWHGIAGRFNIPYTRITNNFIIDDRTPPVLESGIFHSENNQGFPVIVSQNVIRGAVRPVDLRASNAKAGTSWIVENNLTD